MNNTNLSLRRTPDRRAPDGRIPDGRIPESLADASAQEVIDWALDEFGPALTYACSFGVEGMVLIDILARTGRAPRIFTLDTGRLHEETYELIEKVRSRYGLEIEMVAPNTAGLAKMVQTEGPNLFYRGVDLRKRCCHVRKVEPLERALAGAEAWLTGLRREQSDIRRGIPRAQVDEAHGGIIKIMPLADWSRSDVWNYVRAYDVPYNPLHDRGFPSIGCAPCTRAVVPGESERSGRWWWEQDEDTECGLHFPVDLGTAQGQPALDLAVGTVARP